MKGVCDINLSVDELQADGVHLSAADSQQNPVRRRGAEVQTDGDVRAHVIALFHCGKSETSAFRSERSSFIHSSLCVWLTERCVSAAAEEAPVLRPAETGTHGVRRQRSAQVHLDAVKRHVLQTRRQTVRHLNNTTR